MIGTTQKIIVKTKKSFQITQVKGFLGSDNCWIREIDSYTLEVHYHCHRGETVNYLSNMTDRLMNNHKDVVLFAYVEILPMSTKGTKMKLWLIGFGFGFPLGYLFARIMF